MSTVPNAPAPEKKKLSPLAWVAIGCAGVLVLGGLIAAILGMFLVGKVKDVAREMNEDPVAAMAKVVATANPDIELVETDKDARTVTFRDKRSGEEFTVSYDELEKGKMTFSTSGGESTTLEVRTEGEDAGTVTLRGADGTTQFQAGGAVEDLPDWIPMFPGVSPQGSYASQTEGTRAGAFSFETSETLEDVLGFYERAVGSAGLEVKSRTTTPETSLLVAGSAEGDRGLSVVATKKDAVVEVVVNYTEKP